MKLLFVHDHPFYQEDDIIYSGGGLPSSIWNNYLINFSKITVFGRFSSQLKDKKVKSSTEGVSFYLTKKYASIRTLLKNKNIISKELSELIKDTDIVLVRLPSVLGFICGDEALKQNKTLWVEQVGNAKEALNTHGSILGKIVAPFFEYKNRQLVKKAKYITYVTENRLQKDYPSSNSVATAALSNVLINNILNELELDRSRYFKETINIGLIGGFDVRYKGQDVLLKAINCLDPDIKRNIKIHLIGKGNFDWILNLVNRLNIEDNIGFIGSLKSGDQINEFLSTLSLYVQPSLTEGMPRATIEAMAMGCPVIGSDVGGIPDIVSSEFIHKRGNVQELSNHINLLYNDRMKLEQEAILSLKKALPYFKENLDKSRMEFYSKMRENEAK